jgi:hypothetical protein
MSLFSENASWHFHCKTTKMTQVVTGEISGSHGGAYEDDSLLGYCAVQSR